MSQLSPRFAFSVCLCLLACLTVPAQSRWSPTGMSAGSSLWYLDKNFSRKKAGTVAAWEKVVLPDGSFIIGLNEWNCAARKKRLLQSDDYNPAGQTVSHQGTPLPWRFVAPDSIEEITFNIVCGSVSGKENDTRDGRTKPPAAFAAVTKKSALMSDVGKRGAVIRRVNIGEKLVLVGEEPAGIWYRVLDQKTNSEGWLNGNHFKIVKAVRKTGKRKPVGRSRRNQRDQ